MRRLVTKGTLKPESRQEAKLWRALTSAWMRNQIAVTRDIALEYTQAHPRNVWGWVVLAELLGHLALYDRASVALKRAQALAPKSVLPKIWVQWGHLFDKKGARARATTWYKKAVEAKPETQSLIFLGASLAQQGKFSEAKRCYKRAIALGGPRRDEAYYSLGLIQRANGEYRKAIESFDKAIGLDPRYTLARRARADVLRASHRTSDR